MSVNLLCDVPRTATNKMTKSTLLTARCTSLSTATVRSHWTIPEEPPFWFGFSFLLFFPKFFSLNHSEEVDVLKQGSEESDRKVGNITSSKLAEDHLTMFSSDTS